VIAHQPHSLSVLCVVGLDFPNGSPSTTVHQGRHSKLGIKDTTIINTPSHYQQKYMITDAV